MLDKIRCLKTSSLTLVNCNGHFSLFSDFLWTKRLFKKLIGRLVYDENNH